MPASPSELKNTGYEIFIGILSILSIVNLVLVYAARANPDLQNILQIMNALFSAIFLMYFSYRLATASSRSGYFFRHFGWADLLASLPLAQLKFLRIFRLVRVYPTVLHRVFTGLLDHRSVRLWQFHPADQQGRRYVLHDHGVRHGRIR